jgi:hypothetical protein
MRSTRFGFWSPAIRRISRSLLRSSSTCEPSDPLFGVVFEPSFCLAEETLLSQQARNHSNVFQGGGRCGIHLAKSGTDLPCGRNKSHGWDQSEQMDSRLAISRYYKSGYQRDSFSHSDKPMASAVILPQVHLRKPCYDFYFL